MTDAATSHEADLMPLFRKIEHDLEEAGGEALAAFVPRQMVEGIYALAHKAYAAEDYAQAEQLFSAMVLFAAKDQRTWLGLGGALEAQDKLSDAVLAYAAALDLAPGDPVPPLRAGVCLMSLGRVEDARGALATAAGMGQVKDPARAAYVRKAQSLLKMLEPEGA